MRKLGLCVLILLLAWLCSASAEDISVGVSLCDSTSAKGIFLAKDILSHLDSAGLSVSLRNAGSKVTQQVSDIDALIAEGPEYMIVSSARSLGLGEAIHRAAQAGIKVILVDQYATDVQFGDVYARVGVNWGWAAQVCVDALIRSSDDQPLSILEITGPAGTSIVNELSSGFRRSLLNVENTRIAGVLDGGADRQTTNQALTRFIEEKGLCFNAIFAHGDEQALGAINALMNRPDSEDLPIVCVGGMDDAQRALRAGKLYACAMLETDYGNAILNIIEADRLGLEAPSNVSFEGILLFADEKEGP